MACCAIWKKGEKLKNSNGEIKKTTNLCNADIHQFNIWKKTNGKKFNGVNVCIFSSTK